MDQENNSDHESKRGDTDVDSATCRIACSSSGEQDISLPRIQFLKTAAGGYRNAVVLSHIIVVIKKKIYIV